MSDVKPAYAGELMLAGWTQNHTSGAKVCFWLPDDDALEAFKHLTVRKGNTAGQRFMAVLVQIGDDDQPIEPGADTERPKHGLSRSAALICKTEDFQAFVGVREGWIPKAVDARAALAAPHMRAFCRIDSRAELDSSPTAAQLFARLMREYQDWQRAQS